MKTLGVSGSIRSREVYTDYISQRACEVNDLREYISDIDAYQNSHFPIANSDILSGVVLLAMKKLGAEVDYFPLVKLFPRREKRVAYTPGKTLDMELALTDTLALNEEKLVELMEGITSADGIVLVSPVYFGDRSSVANKLLQISGIHDLLQDKVFGAVAVGAKRNGGQETTVIYSLLEALNQNALVVGNGPPTSQYGGTAVGGKKGSVINDLWGLETSFGTGTRVAHVGEIVNKGRHRRLGRPVRVVVLVTTDDTKQTLHSFLEDYLYRAHDYLPNVEFRVDYVLNSTIYRCLGCDTCPYDGSLSPRQKPTKKNHAHCIIQNPEDAMERIHDLLLYADGIIIAGLNVKQHDQLVYRYQVLIERTRYIRRNHFELTDKLLTAFSLTQVGARINSLHPMKTVTSYVRHNCIVHKPIEVSTYDDEVLDDGMNDLIHFVQSAEIIAAGKEIAKSLVTEYAIKGIGGY
jgi:multimeric flavodoxin WrbA